MKHALVIYIIVLLIDTISTGFLECSEHSDCIADNAVCQDNICQCPTGYVYNIEGTQCHPIVIGMQADCVDDQQCGWLLGKYRCNAQKCDCEEGWRFNEGRCTKSSGLNENCTKNTDCFNGYDIFAMVCKEGTCVCNEGYYLRGNYDCRPKSTEIGDYCSLDSDCDIENAACINSYCQISSGYIGTPLNQMAHLPSVKPISGGYDTDCISNNECSALPNTFCYTLTKKCICKRGYFLSDTHGCVPELGLDVGCEVDGDCKITPGRCIEGKCYCRKTYFSAKGNNACQKPMTHDNLYCNNKERCYVLGTAVTCLANTCKCTISAEMDEDFICRETEDPDPGTGGCNDDNDCTDITNSVCSIDAKCECPHNYRLEETTCLPNIGAACDYETKLCTTEYTTCGTDQKCTCIKGYTSNGVNSCLKIATALNDTCEINEQCSEEIKDSNCIESKCTCIDGFIPENNICYLNKVMGDVCTNVLQCHITLKSNVQCRNSKCQCSADMQPTEDGKDCEFPSSAISLFPQTCIILLLTIFYFSL